MRASRLLALCSAGAAAAVLLAAADGGAVVETPRAAEAAPAEATVANGQAQAVLARVVPYVGLPGVAASVGFTAAQVEGDAARASAAAADLGLLGTLAGASAGDNAPALPSPINADSEGNQRVERDPFAAPGAPAAAADPNAPGVGLAREIAEANKDPAAARGTTTGPSLRLPGVLEMSGGRSEARSTTERATSDVTIGSLSLGAGAVVLNGLHWTASQVGRAPATAAFDLGGMTVNGQAMPVAGPAEMADAVAKANEALAPAGLALSVPSRTADASGGTVAPLVIQVRNPESLVAPSAQASDVARPALAELTKAIVAANPDAAAAQIVLNAATGAAGGRSGGRLELGGVSARFARLAMADQGAGTLLPATAPTLPLPAVGATTPGGTAGTPGAPGGSATFGTPSATDAVGGLPAAGTYVAAADVPADPAGGAATAADGVAPAQSVLAAAPATGMNPAAASFRVPGADPDRRSTSVALALGLLAVLVLAAGDRIRMRRLTR